MRLEGRSAVVTGAASGIGRAIARRFAQEGARVVVNDISEEPAPDIRGEDIRPTADVINESGGTGIFVAADVASSDEVDRLVSTAVEQFGRLDIIVNNAATFDAKAILDTTEQDWDALMAVTLRGVFLCCKRAIAQMINQPEVNDVRGRIINISSQHGMCGPLEFSAYAAAKGGVVNLTRQLAVDYARRGIIVNAVAPGRILTGTHGLADDFSHPSIQWELTPPARAASAMVDDGARYSLSRTPFPRLGRPEDVAGAALYLASDDCSFVSGINLLVDGGWMAY